jgi:dihydroxyacetone kinase
VINLTILQTSLNMSGFSLTLLLLPTADEKDAPRLDTILSLLDDKPEVPGWKWSAGTAPLPVSKQSAPLGDEKPIRTGVERIVAHNPKAFVDSIKHAAHALVKAEPEITRMDSIAGDGDCGLTLKVSYVTLPINYLTNSSAFFLTRPAPKVRMR